MTGEHSAESFDPQREAVALSSFEMIQPSEATLRQGLGALVIALGVAVLGVHGIRFFGPGTWTSIFATGILVFRTGSLNQ
jgi:hypothetical protein